MAQFSLCWDVQKNICQGLSSLQQNGEFVDMTLAADGHLVKVHQMVIALASPYLKELITTANSKYPIIFLNRVSYANLCSILEYVYTGEVLVAAEDLKDFIEAAKELHIKGIAEMTVQQCMSTSSQKDVEEHVYYEVGVDDDSQAADDATADDFTIVEQAESAEEMTLQEADNDSIIVSHVPRPKRRKTEIKTSRDSAVSSQMQFTVSNQGSLQMILNRFLYFVKHTNKHNTQWRCVDYISKEARCPAYVITEDNIVVKRVGVHTHAFHDNRILKKLRVGAVYSAIQEAVDAGSIQDPALRRRRPTMARIENSHGNEEAMDGNDQGTQDMTQETIEETEELAEAIVGE